MEYDLTVEVPLSTPTFHAMCRVVVLRLMSNMLYKYLFIYMYKSRDLDIPASPPVGLPWFYKNKEFLIKSTARRVSPSVSLYDSIVPYSSDILLLHHSISHHLSHHFGAISKII